MGVVGVRAGVVVGGDFEIRRPLAEGGMGAVYVALQRSTNEPRALKLMLPAIASNPDLRARFEREARIGARIESDHVVKVIAAGFDEPTGAPWLAMELLRGQDLRAAVTKRGPLSPVRIRQIMTELGHALAAAHDAGIVHRDLKPENLFLATQKAAGRDHMLKILDFGIARIAAEAKTNASVAMGTPLWMAPEQANAGSAITGAADLWAVGLVAFYLLTGHVFWKAAAFPDAGPVAIMKEMLFDPVPSATERAAELGVAELLPEGLDAWFARALERDPTKRPRDTRAFFAELDAILASAPDRPERETSVISSGATQAAAFDPTRPSEPATPAAAGTVPGVGVTSASSGAAPATIVARPAGVRPTGATLASAKEPRPKRSTWPFVAAPVAVAAIAITFAVTRKPPQVDTVAQNDDRGAADARGTVMERPQSPPSSAPMASADETPSAKPAVSASTASPDGCVPCETQEAFDEAYKARRKCCPVTACTADAECSTGRVCCRIPAGQLCGDAKRCTLQNRVDPLAHGSATPTASPPRSASPLVAPSEIPPRPWPRDPVGPISE